jgi:hypothetical protein
MSKKMEVEVKMLDIHFTSAIGLMMRRISAIRTGRPSLVMRGPRMTSSSSIPWFRYWTIPERTTGWNAEEVLRKSKVFPTFHAGPRSFLNQ